MDMKNLDKIREVYLRMMGENRLLPSKELENYYRVFRDNFGPERLRTLDGQTLLETMFNHGKSSLVYWLEFKNDDEFSTQVFGGIGGGSAHKFSLFKKKEDGKWVTGTPKSAKEVTIDEAIAIAKEKRDLLLKGGCHYRIDA